MTAALSSFPKVELQCLLYAGGNQPLRRNFDLTGVASAGGRKIVTARDAIRTPFCTLTEFAAPSVKAERAILIVAPLSGHFAILARDMIAGLLPYFRVYITDWMNVRHVPAGYGAFGFAKNILSIRDFIETLEPGLTVLGLCQGGVAALAATALLASEGDRKPPANLILVAAPIDPLANQTKVVKLLRARPLSWFEESLIATVPGGYAGFGRRVYSAQLRVLPLLTYLTLHIGEGSDTGRKAVIDDGEDPARFPFLDLFTSIMDLDATYFLENTRDVFHDCLLSNGALWVNGLRVDPGRIRSTALLTIEGEDDDIAAPGQTSAAHRLCNSLPQRLRLGVVVPGAGHFSLFHGETWRRSVLPAIQRFCAANGAARNAEACGFISLDGKHPEAALPV